MDSEDDDATLLGERIIWSGRPKMIVVPTIYRVGTWLCAMACIISVASAIVVKTALARSPDQLFAFGGWMLLLACGFSTFPRWWQSKLEYVITETKVIMRRGRFMRTIDRKSISFARIHWHPTSQGVGDLDLVRAVPTGALRRRLAITISGVYAPDRVWAIVRGVAPSVSTGSSRRLLAQRLDEGERVLWSAHPRRGWRVWIPSDAKHLASIALGIVLTTSAIATGTHSIRSLQAVHMAGLEIESVSFVALVASLSLTVILLVLAASAVMYASLVRPARQWLQTRYLITDRRVLIQCGSDELHLDRSQIIDVIETPADRDTRNVFLILDGPRARAAATLGVFGEQKEDGLQPVLHWVADAESARSILLSA